MELTDEVECPECARLRRMQEFLFGESWWCYAELKCEHVKKRSGDGTHRRSSKS
jgi:hypothetical protein